MSQSLTEDKPKSERMSKSDNSVIVVVDDDVSSLKKLEDGLKNRYQVYTSSNKFEAIEHIESLKNIDVMIVNQCMKKMSGIDFLCMVNETIKNADDIIKILINAEEDEDINNSNNLVRIDCCYTKAITPEDIKEKISHLQAQKSKKKITSTDDKRKHIRISYNNRIDFVTEGHTFEGKCMDLSRSGMQVVVKIPESYLNIKSISFHLPELSSPIQIPCKIRRIGKNHGNEPDHVLGIEFFYKTEAQMMLIDNFIRDCVNSKLVNDFKSTETRKIPRIPCYLTDISIDKKNTSIISIDNISSVGCLLSYKGHLASGDVIKFEFYLPHDKRKIKANGSITYVVENNFNEIHSAGVLFTNVAEIDQIRISNFIVNTASSSALMTLQEKISNKIIGEEYRITELNRIETIFKHVMEENIHINVLFEKNQKMFELHIKDIDTEKSVFITTIDKEILSLRLTENHASYFSFYFHSGSYYFKTALSRYYDDRIIFALPTILYHSEKRSYMRKFFGDDAGISIDLDDTSAGPLQGRLIDISRRGFLCEVPHDSTVEDSIKSGQVLKYFLDTNLGLDSYGEIRHITKTTTPDGNKVLQIGVEAGIERSNYKFKKFQPSVWKKGKSYQKSLPSTARKNIISEVVAYENSNDKKIVALLNYTQKNTTAPVVILPPAFGKKKEILSPLVSTLITNFRHHNKDIITIRYDGVNRPGESYNNEMNPKRGYEMLHYKISQGQDDLKSTINYVYDNPDFKPSMVVLVAFSMSALDARKVIIEQDDKKIDYLINVMGATCGQNIFSNVMGGMDIIGNYKIGIPNGLSGVLGHLLDLDNIARDLIDNKYAYVTDARFDMSKVSVPVTWIYGTYDRWIPENEIMDIMSVKAEGAREVIEIPTGHNLRSSDDAIKTFKLITKLIFSKLYNKDITPLAPDREKMVNLITYERERLDRPEDFNPKDYWKDYLIGQGGSVGYDFYKNIKEFRDFLTLQSELIGLEDGESFADIGCGTGLFIENMLKDLAEQGKNLKHAHLVLVDLVHEALNKTRAKYEDLSRSYESLLPQRVDFIQMDLDPNRLIPVAKFMEDPALDLNYLRNRIDGLRNVTIDRLLNKSSEKLYKIMRGAPLTKDDHVNLEADLHNGDYEAIVDFNRASRFLNKNLIPQDMVNGKYIHQRSIMSEYYRNIRTSDLIFNKLNFCNNGLGLNLNFNSNSFNKIAASLFISYLYNPDDIIHEFFRILKPGGRLLVSSMKPDSDISQIFTDYIHRVRNFELEDTEIKNQEMNLQAARAMLNEAAALFELEEDGYFRFYSGEEMVSMFKDAGFKNIRAESSLGRPEQAIIITGEKL